MSEHTKLLKILNSDIDKIDITDKDFLNDIYDYFIIIEKFEKIRKLNDHIRDSIKSIVSLNDVSLKIKNFEFIFEIYESKKRTTINLSELKKQHVDIYDMLVNEKIIDEHTNEKTVSVRDLVLKKLY